ncbi:MAG: Unknown protein [uncultured Aureispira sp.]|uniref:Uncharacterized protein n=1 Tax=uncultured Aureispira sp. TaxID=1331704 RepID=A0A6S6U7Z2_9BACT|nr:MAG: Unknown protein [uncultured Aureispira sp.]
MKHLTYVFALLMLVACVDETPNVEETTVSEVSVEASLEKAKQSNEILTSQKHQDFLGAYVGMFNGVEVKDGGSVRNKINISIALLRWKIVLV